jgi:DNA primase catalytic core
MSYPIANLADVIARVGETLDLRAVIVERYGVALELRGERWAGECFLPSTVDAFTGSCADQDAAEKGGDRPTNLFVSLGERTLVWRCHSCQRHGDVIDLIGYAENVPRNETRVGLGAVRRAAVLAGLAWMMDGASGPRARDVASLDLVLAEPLPTALRTTPTVDVDRARALNEYVRKIWTANLYAPDDAAVAARGYLAERGVSPEQARRHGLGFARRGSQIAEKLLGLEGNVIDLALAMGLVKQRVDEKTGERRCFDAQRERIVFPYTEPGERLVVSGFAGRPPTDTLALGQPKWLNSNTVAGLWSKKSAMFGLHSAIDLARDSTRCVVSEGNLDVLAWERADVPAVSTVGVEFTVQHATVLQRYGFRRVTICFDGDEAGRLATPNAIASLLTVGYTTTDVHVIDLADAQDPDDLSIDEAQRAYDCPLSIVEFVTVHVVLFTAHTDKLASLLPWLPDDERTALVELLHLDPERVRARPPTDIDASLGQRIVRAVLAHAAACVFIDAAEIKALLVDESHLLDLIRSVSFGDHTNADRLPLALQREIARAKLDHARRVQTADAALNLWRYGQTIDAYRKAWTEREQLEKNVRSCESEALRLDVIT